MSIGIGVGLTDLPVLGSDLTNVINEFYRLGPSFLPANAKLPIIRDNWSSALGGTPYSINGASHIYDALASAQANKVWEAGEQWAGSVDIMPSTQLTYARHEFSAYFDFVETGSVPTGAAFLGLELGTINSDPAFPAAPSFPCLQLRINRTLPTASGVQLYSAVGDGTTAATVVNDTSGVFFTVPYETLLQLVWEPVIPRARAYVAGVLCCEITDPSKLPNYGSVVPKARAGLIMSSGSGWQVKGVFTDAMLLKIK